MLKRRTPSPANFSDQVDLGRVVRKYRHELGITQEELASRANLHRTYLADIERGGRNITLRSIANLARALEVSMGSLFGAGGGAAPGEPTGVPGEILLVEDNPNDIELTLRAFKRAKFTNPVRVARDGEEALAALGLGSRPATRRAADQPQLVLLDLGLPKIPGLEVLRALKAEARTRKIPVIVLTVSSDDRDIFECARLGAAHYILKPVGIENFVNVTPKLNLHLTLGSS